MQYTNPMGNKFNLMTHFRPSTGYLFSGKNPEKFTGFENALILPLLNNRVLSMSCVVF